MTPQESPRTTDKELLEVPWERLSEHEKRSRIMKRLWANPEYRSRQSENAGLARGPDSPAGIRKRWRGKLRRALKRAGVTE